MALSRFLLDENLPPKIRHAINRHNLSSEYSLNAVAVGDFQDLPLGSGDPVILRWAEREQRLLVTEDRTTMAGHLAAHLTSGRYSPGIFSIRPDTRTPELIEFLVLAAYASDAEEWRDRIKYIPWRGSRAMGHPRFSGPSEFINFRAS